jgi:hypothetical protein
MFIIARQNHYFRRFQQMAATTPSRAMTLAEVGVRDSRLFRKLLRRGSIAVAPSGRYYLVHTESREFLAHRRRAALIGLALAGTALTIGMFVRLVV